MTSIRKVRVKIPYCKDLACGWSSQEWWFPFEQHEVACMKCGGEVKLMNGIHEIPEDMLEVLKIHRQDIADCIIE